MPPKKFSLSVEDIDQWSLDMDSTEYWRIRNGTQSTYACPHCFRQYHATDPTTPGKVYCTAQASHIKRHMESCSFGKGKGNGQPWPALTETNDDRQHNPAPPIVGTPYVGQPPGYISRQRFTQRPWWWKIRLNIFDGSHTFSLLRFDWANLLTEPWFSDDFATTMVAWNRVLDITHRTI